MRKLLIFWSLFASIVALSSCEKVLDIELPESASGIVFEGAIENGSFPYMIISRSEPYFAPISTAAEALANSLVDDAEVYIEVDGMEYPMNKICINSLPPEFQEQALEALGFNELPPIDICIYANLTISGEVGKTYRMRAIVDEEEYTATTSIGNPVSIDSLWFKDEFPTGDSLGSIWFQIRDPDTLGNYYFLWTENLTQNRRMYPISGGGSFGDRLFNGELITFNMFQGSSLAGQQAQPEEEEEDEIDDFWFVLDDTVVVKLGVIDKGVYDFWESVDAASNLNPFSAPTPVFSNISNGGRGVWAGYGVTLDTVICRLDG